MLRMEDSIGRECKMLKYLHSITVSNTSQREMSVQMMANNVQSDKAETYKNRVSTLVFGSRNPLMYFIITRQGRENENN